MKVMDYDTWLHGTFDDDEVESNKHDVVWCDMRITATVDDGLIKLIEIDETAEEYAYNTMMVKEDDSISSILFTKTGLDIDTETKIRFKKRF